MATLLRYGVSIAGIGFNFGVAAIQVVGPRHGFYSVFRTCFLSLSSLLLWMAAVVAKVIGALLVVVSAYFYGYHQGQNAEELNHARTQISALTAALEEHKAKQASDAVALANLRIDESRARDELDRMRGQLSELERRAKTAADRQRNRCLQLAVEGRELLGQALRAVRFCAENHR
ncbi:hypothetical protein [uncultured Parasutterella sp.]|uniref:hypothetical protein n=1 Tax=uncultured Parasutterella sp. TaxID=1263098 RepID=UPI0034A1E50E